MVVLIVVDLINVSRYVIYMYCFEFILRWCIRFLYILIDYMLCFVLSDDDYYVLLKLVDKVLVVKLVFSKCGCESMSCYLFYEIGVVFNMMLFMYM